MTMVGESSTMSSTRPRTTSSAPADHRARSARQVARDDLVTLVLGLAINLFRCSPGWRRGAPGVVPARALVTLVLLVLFCSAVVVFVYACWPAGEPRTFDTVASWSQVCDRGADRPYQIVPHSWMHAGVRIDAANPLLLFCAHVVRVGHQVCWARYRTATVARRRPRARHAGGRLGGAALPGRRLRAPVAALGEPRGGEAGRA